MAKSSKPRAFPKLELLSVTFKLNGKIHAIALSTGKKKTTIAKGFPVAKAAAGPPGASETRCINGTLHVELCLGNDCKWIDTGQPC